MTHARMSVVYVPTPLRTMKEICQTLGVSQKTVREWVERGAPIAVEGEGTGSRYSAELAGLQAWRVAGAASEHAA